MKETVSLKEFLFQKSYAEEMVECLHAFMFGICDVCQHKNGLYDEHSYACERDLLKYWDEAKHYFSMKDVLENSDKRCEKYELEPFTWHEITLALCKVETEWKYQLQAMTVILNI